VGPFGRRETLAAFLVSLAVLGCGAHVPRAGEAPPGPRLDSPLDAVPPDLDWIVRLDVGRIFAALGSSVVAGLRQKALEREAEGTERFLTDALERARVVVIAARYDGGRFADLVIALDGDFKGLDPRRYAARPPWQPALDLGGDVRRYDRGRPRARSDAMRLYLGGDHLIVAASEAELDSIETVVERGAPPSHLVPRERGLVSLAVRTSAIAANNESSSFAGFLRGARTTEGFVDAHGDGFRLEASCELGTEADAKRTVDALERVRAALETTEGGRFASLARNTKFEANGAFVVARAELSRAVLSDLTAGTLG
jgi:hypothetical protein